MLRISTVRTVMTSITTESSNFLMSWAHFYRNGSMNVSILACSLIILKLHKFSHFTNLEIRVYHQNLGLFPLPTIAKIFEKSLHRRIISFLVKFDVLSSSQFGFRAKKCTIDVVLFLIEVVRQKLSDKSVFFCLHIGGSQKCLQYT